MKKVMIATPSYSGKVSVYYMNSMVESIKGGLKEDIDIVTVIVPGEALVQKARNELLRMAYESKVEQMVFIDDDIFWNWEDLRSLILSEKDFIGGTYRRKNPFVEFYVLKAGKSLEYDKEGLLPVDGLGMGFTKLSRKVIEFLWKKSESYFGIDEEGKYTIETRRAFEVTIAKDKTLMGEDISACNTWLSKKGNKIYLDPEITVGHVGSVSLLGDFKPWIERIKKGIKHEK